MSDAMMGDERGLRAVRMGFLPLTDCAPLLVARRLGLDRRHGLLLRPLRQPSWTAVRDKLIRGELDAALALHGLAYGMELGLGGPQCDMALLMGLNRNGQGISLRPDLAARWLGGAALPDIAAGLARPLRLAHTFPTGTHAMWLHYWLAAQGLHPLRDARCVVIPPPQMGAAMRAGELDGFCAGQPWHAMAEREGSARLVADSAAVWPDHPEKALICRRSFADGQPGLAMDLIAALLQACRWLDEPDNRVQAAAWLAEEAWLGVPAERILQHWQAHPQQAAPLRFFDEGRVNFPWLSDGLWFLRQYRRWGMWDGVDDLDVVAAVSRRELYRQAAASVGVAAPDESARRSVLMDGEAWPPAGWSLPKSGAGAAFSH